MNSRFIYTPQSVVWGCSLTASVMLNPFLEDNSHNAMEGKTMDFCKSICHINLVCITCPWMWFFCTSKTLGTSKLLKFLSKEKHIKQGEGQLFAKMTPKNARCHPTKEWNRRPQWWLWADNKYSATYSQWSVLFRARILNLNPEFPSAVILNPQRSDRRNYISLHGNSTCLLEFSLMKSTFLGLFLPLHSVPTGMPSNAVAIRSCC